MKTVKLTLLFIIVPLFFLMAQKQVLIDGGKAGDFYYKGNDKNGNVGIGSKNPAQKLEVNGSINLGVNRSDDTTKTNFQGNKLHFLGANENSDPFWMGRYNVEYNISELRVNIGDDPSADQPVDKFVVGTTAPMKTGEWTSKFTVRSDGNVGIGTNDPKEKLHVNGGLLKIQTATGTLKIGSQNEGWTHFSTGGKTVAEKRFLFSNDIYVQKGGLSTQVGPLVLKAAAAEGIRIDNETLNVGIGTKTPDMKLTVNGKVHAKGMRIDTVITADYVFEKFYTGASKLNPKYKMPTLKEVEAFTKKYHHLPEVPSVKEVREHGLIVEDMTILMLQKIEELTLYTIQQEKRINTLETKNNKLQNENVELKALAKRLEALEKFVKKE